MQTIIPYLYYEDVDCAVEWLAGAFGFKEYDKRFSGPDGKTKHAAMQFNDGLFMLGSPGSKYKNPKRLGQTTQCVLVHVSKVDEQYERAKKAGATIIEPLENTPFGQRRFGAADPEGHHWYFAQELRKQSRRTPK